MSLTLSGVLTGYLVTRLQVQNTEEQLARFGIPLRNQVISLSCRQRVRLTGRCLAPTDQPEFLDTVATRFGGANLGDSRLILLDRQPDPGVLYDSHGRLASGQPFPLPVPRTVAGQRVATGSVRLAGVQYVIAALPTPGSRFSGWLVLARPRAAVVAQATGQLVPPLLLSAGAALTLAVMIALLLARAFSRPLNELKRAAEDVAAGNYSRRVTGTGADEIGVVGQSFNRMAEAVERGRRLQRDFLANVSHELKTPLTSLIGFSQALLDGSLRSEEERRYAAQILHEEAQRVLRMSQELLDLARVESGQLDLNPQPLDLAVQLGQELEIVRPRAQARELRLELSVSPQLPPVRADPERLHQVLENLLDNAVKYAPAGTPVAISALPAALGRVGTVISNRVGPNPPDPHRMFDRFYRADPSRSSAGGVGLGLAISRELAAAHGGSLSASLDGGGLLSLRLELPAAAPPGPARAPEPRRRPLFNPELPPSPTAQR